MSEGVVARDASSELEGLRVAVELAGVCASEVILPDEGDLIVGGLRLHYLDWGTLGRPPLVFLHGGALTARTWDLVCVALHDHYRCLALDQRGHGDSEWSPTLDYSLEAYVADIRGVADALGLDRFTLIGQSLGAFNALAYAARHPDRVSALAVIDAGPEVRPEGAWRVADFVLAPAELDSVEEFVERARAFNPRRDERLLRRSIMHNLRQLPSGRWTWKYDRRHLSEAAFRDLMERLVDLRAELGSIRCPVLVVRGADSDVFSDADADRLARDLSDGRWVRVEGAGHTVQGDNPAGLVTVLREFLARASSR